MFRHNFASSTHNDTRGGRAALKNRYGFLTVGYAIPNCSKYVLCLVGS